MKAVASYLLLCGFGLALAGCGGGESGSSTAATSGSTAITINSSNATAVAQAAIGEATGAVDVGSGLGSSLVGVAVQESVVRPGDGLVIDTLRQIEKALAHKPSETVLGVVTTEVVPCQTSGHYIYTGEITNSGDNAQISYVNCIDGDFSYSGNVAFIYESAVGSGSFGFSTASMVVTYSNFVTTSDGVTVSLNGGFAINASQTSSTSFSASLNLNNFRTILQTSSGVVSNSLQNGTLAVTGSTVNLSSTTTVNFTSSGVWTGGLSGQVSLVTESGKPLVLSTSGQWVAGGVLVVTGNNSKLRITILSATTASVQLDANNDGIYESTSVITI